MTKIGQYSCYCCFFHHQNQFFPIFSLLWHIVVLNYVIPSIATVCETVPGSVSNCFLRNWELSISTIPHAFPPLFSFIRHFYVAIFSPFPFWKNSEWVFLLPKSFSFLFFATVNKSHLFINLFLSTLCQKKGNLVWKSFQKPLDCQKINFSTRFLCFFNIKCHIYFKLRIIQNSPSCLVWKKSRMAKHKSKCEFSASQVQIVTWILDFWIWLFLITRIITEVLKSFTE